MKNSRRKFLKQAGVAGLAATVKAQFKQDWTVTIPRMVTDSYFDLQNDIREKEPESTGRASKRRK